MSAKPGTGFFNQSINNFFQMKNYIQPGDAIDVTATAVVASGDLVTVGALVGVAVTDAAIGDLFAMNTEGVFALPKAAGTLTMGTKVMVDSVAAFTTGSNVVVDDGTKIYVGIVTETSAGTTVKVKLGA